MKAFNPFGNVKQTPIAEQDTPETHSETPRQAAQDVHRNSSFSFEPTIKKNVSTTQDPQAQREPLNKISTVQKGGFRLDQATQHNDIYPAKTHNVHNEVPSFEEKKEKITAYEEMKILFNAKREKVRSIKISEIAKQIGASNREDKIKNKWKMPWGHNVSIRGQQWFNHNSDFTNRGGRDAVSFAKYIMATEKGLNLDDNKEAWEAERLAVQWLVDTFEAEIDKSDLLMAKENLQEREKKRYTPPKKAEKYLKNVIDYLHIQRKLPMWVIEKQIEANKLYAGIPKNFETFYSYDISGKKILKDRDLNELQENEIYCIFKSGDEKMGAAECRCVADENSLGFTKGFSEGSEKKYSGFFVVGEPGFEQKEVVLTEAAIDSMSYQVIYPWAHVMSTGGTDNSELMLRIVCETLEHPLYNMVLGFDNDSAGEQTYRFILDKVKERYPEEFEGWIESGKLSRKVPPREKDWNQYLTTCTEQELLSFYHKNTYEAATSTVEEDTDKFTKNVITSSAPDLLTDTQPLISPEIAKKRVSFTFDSLSPKMNNVNAFKKTRP